MKTGTTEKMKFKKLAIKLKLSKWETVGLLETLWAVTATNTPAGDIGALSNEDIAFLIEWPRDHDELIDALVSTCWLDADPEYRLIVHDWSEHVPNHLKGAFAKHGKSFANEVAKGRTKPMPSTTNGIAKHAAKHDAEGSEHVARQVPPNLTIPNQVKSNQTKPVRAELEPSASTDATQPPVPIGSTEQPAFPQVRSGRLTFDRRMMPLPAVLDTPAFAAAWDRFLSHRVDKGSVTTEDEARGMLAKFSRYGPMEACEIIRRTIEERGWLSPDWPKDQPKKSTQASKGVFDGTEQF